MSQLLAAAPFLVPFLCAAVAAAIEPPDETPAKPGEWGFRPADGEIVERTPPPFVWRPQEDARGYVLQIAADQGFESVVYERADVELNCLCPESPLQPGTYYWRFAYQTETGDRSPWSSARRFEISPKAVAFPRPVDSELFSRLPDHPRLFFRPEDLPRMRNLARTKLKGRYEQLVADCEKLLAEPPDVSEPPKYPEDMERLSLEWLDMWWGNRRRVVAVTNAAATLALTYLLSGEDRYAAEARRLILAACSWDPKGSTGFRYNDEAGMPFMYYGSRTYTWLHHYLSEDDRGKIQAAMRVRGGETYDLLCPRHIWRPFSSHSNRSWHFLGEMGIAFYGEIPEAEKWIPFAVDVFFCAYPVWSDSDGGWHEGASYWSSYLSRQTWWLDVQRAAFGIDGYDRPFFKRAGDFALYMVPPGTESAPFGDLTAGVTARSLVGIMSIFARQAHNPYWQWYADEAGGAQEEGGYIGFLRALEEAPEPQVPADLPTSKHFRGTGYAVLHSDLVHRDRDVQVSFKSSPFGGYSHGYDAQNAFFLHVWGKPVLIRTGRRDGHGSEHHRKWMHETRSVNSILVNGEGQVPHSFAAAGRILQFFTSDGFDYVSGDATEAYGGKLDRAIRRILFVKPDAIVIHDELAAPNPSTFQWLLHATNAFEVAGQQATTANGEGAVQVTWLAPAPLKISQTNEFDPPPRNINLVQWHLTAETTEPAGEAHFITILQPYRTPNGPPEAPAVQPVEGGWIVTAPAEDGPIEVAVRRGDGGLEWRDQAVAGPMAAWRLAGDEVAEHCVVGPD